MGHFADARDGGKSDGTAIKCKEYVGELKKLLAASEIVRVPHRGSGEGASFRPPNASRRQWSILEWLLPGDKRGGADPAALGSRRRLLETWKLSALDLKSCNWWCDYSRARDEMFAATRGGRG